MNLQLLFLVCFIGLVKGQLRCFHCENQPTLQDCLRNGRVDRCLENEMSCATEVRRRNNGLLYFKSCKESLACFNNEIQNPRDAYTPTQCNEEGDVSVCRCCCFFDECGQQENCTDSSSTTTTTTTTRRPIVRDPTFSSTPTTTTTTTTTTTATTTENTPPEGCRHPPLWEDGEVICPPQREGGGWQIGTVCEYRCLNGATRMGNRETECTRQENRFGQEVIEFQPGPPCCEPRCIDAIKADIVFVLDASTSVGLKNWGKMVNFVNTLAEMFKVSAGGVHFGVIPYSYRVLEEWAIKLDDYGTVNSFRMGVNRIDYPPPTSPTGTVTVAALQFAANNAFTEKFGYRPEVKNKLVIFVTDGRSTDNVPATQLRIAANNLKNVATRVFAVGINLQGRDELDIIASNRNDISEITFDELTSETLLERIKRFICNPRCTGTRDQEERCIVPPIWEEGQVSCPRQEVPHGWRIGTECEYICPEGYKAIGNSKAECARGISKIYEGLSAVHFQPGPPCCEQNCIDSLVADVVFILDGSTSVGEQNWMKLVNFVARIARLLKISPQGVNMGVITYNSRVLAEWSIRLNFYQNPSYFKAGIERVRYFNNGPAGTVTVAALDYAYGNAFTPLFGARPSAERIIIFVSGSEPTDNEPNNLLSAAADRLKTIATKVYAIGLNAIQKSELNAIASSPADVSDVTFDQLSNDNLLQRIQGFICDSRCRHRYD